MLTKEKLKELEKRGIITRKPKPIFIFLLFFAYFLVWFVVSILYLKYDIKTLKIWIIIIGIFTLITLIHALVHRYIVNMLNQN